MQVETWQFFLLLGSSLAVLTGLYLRVSEQLRWDQAVVCAAVLCTAPIGSFTGGSQGLIYATDLLLPFLIYRSRRAWVPDLRRRHLLIAFAVMLVLMPLLTTAVAYIVGSFETSEFELRALALHLYRNLVIFSILAFMVSRPMTRARLAEIMELSIILGATLAVFGVLHYVGVFDSNMFDRYSQATEELVEMYNRLGAGTGFAGMFRGAVGQTFAMLGITALAYLFMPEKSARFSLLAWGLLLVATFLIVRSFSRAGLLGLAVGLIFLSVLYARRLLVIGAIAAIVIYGGAELFSDVQLEDRFFGATGSDVDKLSSGRWASWAAGLEALEDHPMVALAGVGAANDNGVADLIGLWGAHNEYLDLVLKCGLFALVAYFVVAVKVAVVAARAALGRTDPFPGRYLAALFVANVIIAFTQAHLTQAHATYTTIGFIYLLYGALLAAILVGERGPFAVRAHAYPPALRP